MQVITDYELGHGVQEIWADDAPLRCYSVPRNSLSKEMLSIIQNNNQKCFVYFLINDTQASGINEKGEINKRDIYVGKTYSLDARKYDHKSKKPWWNRIVLFTKEEKFFKSTDIEAIEHILIEWYWDLPQYNRQNGRGSTATITDTHKHYADYIVSIMEHLTYGCDFEKEEILSDKQIDSNQALQDKIFRKIFDIRKSIQSDPKKLYTSFIMKEGAIKKFLCAVWPKKGGEWYEVEFYSNIKSLDSKLQNYVKIRTNRSNRECVMSVRNDDDINHMVSVIKNIIGIKIESDSDKRDNKIRFKFSMVGLKPGDKIYLKSNPSIVVTVHSDDKVEYEGNIYSLSPLAEKLTGKTVCQGPREFAYNGVSLDVLRKQKYGK